MSAILEQSCKCRHMPCSGINTVIRCKEKCSHGVILTVQCSLNRLNGFVCYINRIESSVRHRLELLTVSLKITSVIVLGNLELLTLLIITSATIIFDIISPPVASASTIFKNYYNLHPYTELHKMVLLPPVSLLQQVFLFPQPSVLPILLFLSLLPAVFPHL